MSAQSEPIDTSQSGLSGTIRVLAVMNNRKSLDSALTYIEKQDYQLHIANQILDMVKALALHKPHIVLLSWNLKGIDVRKVYRLLTQRFKIICIVFAEETNKKTTSALMNSSIPHFLLSPVSGSSIHTRIQSLIRPKYRKPRPIKKDKAEVASIDRVKIPPKLEWEQTPDPENPGATIWKNVQKEGQNFGGIFYFRGKKAPTYDSAKQQWNTGGGVVLFEKDENERGFSVEKEDPTETAFNIQESYTEENISSFIMELDEEKLTGKTEMFPLSENKKPKIETKETERSNKLGIAALEGESTQDKGTVKSDHDAFHNFGGLTEADIDLEKGKIGTTVDSILAKAVKKTYTKCASALQAPIDEKTKVTKTTVCTLDSAKFRGYLICVSSIDDHQSLFMKRVSTVLKEELSYLGEVIIDPIHVLEVEMPPTFFLEWAREKSDFYVTSKKTGLGLAFFSAPDLPEPQEVEGAKVLGISAEKHLVPDTEVLFDVFIHLPKNQKYLRYLKKGQTFSFSISSKFIKHAINNLYIEKDAKEDFLAYQATNFLTSAKSK